MNDSSIQAKSDKVKPWRRFWARFIDNYISAISLSLIFILLDLSGKIFDNPYSFGMFSLFIWIFIESCLLSTWGTTPGKWLLNIELKNKNGEKLNFSPALKRSFEVWLRGEAIGFPFISLFTLHEARKRLINEGEAPWDKTGNFTVSLKKVSTVKLVISILAISSLISLNIWSRWEENQENLLLTKITTCKEELKKFDNDVEKLNSLEKKAGEYQAKDDVENYNKIAEDYSLAYNKLEEKGYSSKIDECNGYVDTYSSEEGK